MILIQALVKITVDLTFAYHLPLKLLLILLGPIPMLQMYTYKIYQTLIFLEVVRHLAKLSLCKYERNSISFLPQFLVYFSFHFHILQKVLLI